MQHAVFFSFYLLATGCVELRSGTTCDVKESSKEVSVLVLGGVLNPGVYQFHSPECCSLRGLVRKMGGMSTLLTTRNIRILRGHHGGLTRVVIDIEQIINNPNVPDIQLLDGDRIIFPNLR